MLSQTHISFGIMATIALVSIKTQNNFYELVPGAILGSCAPDIDTKASWVSQTIPFIDDMLRKYGFLKHRGVTHSIWAIIAMVLLYATIKNDFMLGFSIGYISHIVLDFISSKIKVTTKHDKIIYNIIWILNTVFVLKIAI